ncbi:MAG: hypothetical protein H5U40_14360 [Polyangiaceae bacterium]|nr:hypothetical protein [Polyangiaceae bacterium]
MSLVDVVPTVLHATGLPPDSSLVGRSLLGAELEPRPAVFETQGIWGLFDGRFKLVRTSRDGAMRLFDLVTDPEERRDIAAERPREVERLRALYAEAGRRQEAPSPAPEPAPSPAATDVEIDVEIDEATEARLRELGYIR